MSTGGIITEATALDDLEMHRKFAAALADVETIRKDREADAGKFTIRYADINQVLHMLKPILLEHGLALSQPITLEDGWQMVTTLLVHVESGSTLVFPGPAFQPKADPQANGSAITYYRRYGLVSLFALEQEDDDGGTAHRAAVDPHNRTPAETEIRSLIDAMPKEQQSKFIRQFREAIGMTLSDLPASQHGDALTWAKAWTYVPDADPEEPASRS